ncbi:MAG: TolC family protein [Verrucomicrobiae bacterium]|nr:TolC family protein [Verrucomicrobiae bacterium]
MKRFKITFLLTSIWCLCHLPLAAGESESDTNSLADLDDAIAYGISHNPGILAAWQQYQAALEKIPQAKGLPDPRLMVNHFVEEIETRTGPQRNQVFLTQMIPWFGKLRLRGEVASKEAEAIHHAYEARILMLTRDISIAWYEYAYLGKSTEITRQNLDLLKRLEDTVREKVRAGNDLAPLLRLEVELAKAQDMLQGMEKQRLSQSAALNALLGRESTEPISWPDLPEPVDRRMDRESLKEELLAGNPELCALQSRIEKAEGTLELSKRSPIPDPMIGAGIFDTGESVMPNQADSGNDPWAIQLSFSIPLWSGKYKAEKREAEAGYEAARQSRTDRENTLVAELESALQKLSEIDQRLDLYSDTLLPKAKQAVEVTESSYRADRASLLDVIDSERTQLEIERTYWRAVADHHQSMVRLQTLTGETKP